MIEVVREIITSGQAFEFDELAMEVFRFQAEENKVYQQYLKLINKDISQVQSIEEIPFLPIEFFKTRKITSSTLEHKVVFTSSGTTSNNTSKHYLDAPEFYLRNARGLFEATYGPIEDYVVLGLLPSYLERTGSSLITMVDDFIKQSAFSESGFYLNEYDALYNMLLKLKSEGKKVLLIGVTFGLLDFAENFSLEPADDTNLIVMETGGMKGRRKEMTRNEVHSILQASFKVDAIHSEYGMTELLSQSYSLGQGIYKPSSTMQVFLRDVSDPFLIDNGLRYGAINIVDLANVHSCSFIATQDLGRVVENGFKVIGRMDNSDMRGCNLMI